MCFAVHHALALCIA